MQVAKGAIMASTLNIRIDSTLKERGDKVLRENGISVTEAIRVLWETLAKTHELPEFLQGQDPKKEAMRKKLDAIERSARATIRWQVTSCMFSGSG